MEVSLKKAGFTVTTAIHGKDALEKLQISKPDLVLTNTHLPELDGFELCRILKQDSRFGGIPFIFFTGEKSVAFRLKGLELGANDFLIPPIYMQELVMRVRVAVQRKDKERLESGDEKAGFSGNLMDMGVVDLVQTFELGRKTGVIKLEGGGGGSIYLREGKVLDAQLGRMSGENAFYRMLNIQSGKFELIFGPVDRPEAIGVSTQGLLMEGMRRWDEWARLVEQLPPLDSVFEVDYQKLAARLFEIPDEIDLLLRLLDGKRTLGQVVEDAEMEDLASLGAISKLYFAGMIREPVSSARDTGLAEVSVKAWLDVPRERAVASTPPPAVEQLAAAEIPVSTAPGHSTPPLGLSSLLPPAAEQRVVGAEREIPVSPGQEHSTPRLGLRAVLPPVAEQLAAAEPEIPAFTGQGHSTPPLGLSSLLPPVAEQLAAAEPEIPASYYLLDKPAAQSSASQEEIPTFMRDTLVDWARKKARIEPHPPPVSEGSEADSHVAQKAPIERFSPPVAEPELPVEPPLPRSDLPSRASPSRKTGGSLPWRRVAWVAVAGIGGFLAVAMAISMLPGLPQAFSRQLQRASTDALPASAALLAPPASPSLPVPASDEPVAGNALSSPQAIEIAAVAAQTKVIASVPGAPAESEARPVQTKAVATAREAPAIDPEPDYGLMLKRGANALRYRRFKTALGEYRKALAIRPDSIDAKAGVGIALVNTNAGAAGYQEAVDLLQQAVSEQQNNAKAWLALGMAFQFTAQEKKAEEAYKRYLYLEPAGASSADIRAMLKQNGP
jgi:CheY-like chemotaxis protein